MQRSRTRRQALLRTSIDVLERLCEVARQSPGGACNPAVCRRYVTKEVLGVRLSLVFFGGRIDVLAFSPGNELMSGRAVFPRLLSPRIHRRIVELDRFPISIGMRRPHRRRQHSTWLRGCRGWH